MPRLRGSSSGSTSRYSSEDWVQQADSLTIDSPLIAHSNLAFGVTQNAAMTGGVISDEPMVRTYIALTLIGSDFGTRVQTMDSEETVGIYRPSTLVSRNSQQSPPRPHVPQIQITTTNSTAQLIPPVQYQPHLQYESTSNSFLAAPSQHTHTLQPQHGQPPTICVLPATPGQSPLTPHDQASHQGRTYVNSPTSPMSISSPSSAATSRKQRFTMGPRSDCEKCRLGVKGHWMHVD